MTSLNMPGFSLTLLLLPGSGEPYSSAQILELLDAPASAPGWKWTSAEPGKLSAADTHEAPAPTTDSVSLAGELYFENLTKLMARSCRRESLPRCHHSSVQEHHRG